MRNIRIAFVLMLVLAMVFAFGVQAQNEELTISFSRDFGYSSGGGDIQGLFSIKVGGPDTLTKVVFYIDDKVIGEDTEAPFKLQFTTDDYPPGEHAMYAVGTTSDGRELKTKVVHANFVTEAEGNQAALRIVIPILGVAVIAILLSTVLPLVLTRGKLDSLPFGTQRNYTLGGAICPKCKRPFAMHFYGMNLGLSKLDRCPYCGKWSVVRRASIQVLRAAEQDELEMMKAGEKVAETSEEEKLKKQLDDSKYQ